MDWIPEPQRTNIPGFEFDLEAAREKFIGMETESVVGRYPVEYDPIRRHCHMTGDTNPLFLEPEYAAKSKYGAVIVPPPFVGYFAGPGIWPKGQELPQLPAISAPGDRNINMTVEAEWLKPVRVGERLSVKSRYADLYFLSIRLDWTALWTTTERIIMNEAGETVCIERGLGLRHRAADQVLEGQKGPPNVPAVPPPPMPDAGGRFDGKPAGRGTPRLWEDVQEGDPLVRLEFPITETRIAEQVSGSQDFYAVHHDREFAKAAGHPDIFVNTGFMRGCLGRVVTDWIGAEGWLQKFRMEMRRMNRPGDTMVCQGRVVRKYEENGEHLVECQVWAENEREGVTTPCRAWVALPSRS